MSLIKNKTKSIFLKSSSQILSLYEFKTFKKNLRFKKYNLNITKFIKNRKKYTVRKRRTSNIISYLYMYTWAKFYMVSKQNSRYIQLQSLGNYAFISRTITSSLITNKLNGNLTINLSKISKNIFFNLTLFFKYRYYFYKKLFFNEGITIISISSLDITKNSLLIGTILFSNYTYKSLNSKLGSKFNTQHTYFFTILINILINKIISHIISVKKLITLLILSQKFLK